MEQSYATFHYPKFSLIGEYHVALPDGRLQTVTYKVDDAYSGVIMDVKYSDYGKPHAPVVHKGGYKEPIVHKAPIVHKPVYHAEPIHKAPIYHA